MLINFFLALRKYRVPATLRELMDLLEALQQRVRGYYEHLWESRLGYDESSVLSELPPSLRLEISLYLNQDIIQKVPLFKGAPDEFVREIVNALKPVVFTPGDYIVRSGEVGEEMYFISRGTVEVVSPEGDSVFATLTDGQFFGEIALVTKEPRTASIRAADYCDLYMLDKSTFDRVLQNFPALYSHIRELAQTRLRSRRD